MVFTMTEVDHHWVLLPFILEALLVTDVEALNQCCFPIRVGLESPTVIAPLPRGGWFTHSTLDGREEGQYPGLGVGDEAEHSTKGNHPKGQAERPLEIIRVLHGVVAV